MANTGRNDKMKQGASGMIQVRNCRLEDHEWRDAALRRHFGDVKVARQAALVDASALPCALAFDGDTPAGFICWSIAGQSVEVVALAADQQGCGVGQALLAHVKQLAVQQNLQRLYLFTTNDNIRALAFYQQFGMVVCKWHHDAVKAARALKPAIPLVADNGIPIRDEVELEIRPI